VVYTLYERSPCHTSLLTSEGTIGMTQIREAREEAKGPPHLHYVDGVGRGERGMLRVVRVSSA
jgi:hypothetical protein